MESHRRFSFARTWMPRADAEAFADRLRDSRKASSMTQSEFAEKMGVSINTANGWENARTQPMPEKISRMAEIIGAAETYLRNGAQIDEDGEPQSRPSENDATAIVEEARRKIALVKGVPPDHVRISIDL